MVMIKTFGRKNGQCNVCGSDGPLSEDHTPPKGCLKPTQVMLKHITALLTTQPHTFKGRHSQSGVKYRTLCLNCNNNLLGAKYDPPFIAFVNSVGRALNSPLALPDEVTIRGQPQAILRSLIGHMSAQGVGRYLKGPLTETVRDFVLDTTRPLPAELRAFYWAYPFRPHVMVRDAAYMDTRSGKNFLMWLLKFFPIAFLIAWDDPVGLDYPMQSFDAWRHCAFDTEVDLPLRLRPIPPEYWPEAPTDHSILLYGQEAVTVGNYDSQPIRANRARRRQLRSKS